jgi:hypothetical protein
VSAVVLLGRSMLPSLLAIPLPENKEQILTRQLAQKKDDGKKGKA